MWWKVAAGAVIGLVAGHWIPPGYALWVVLGGVAGFLADHWAKGRNDAQDQGSVKT